MSERCEIRRCRAESAITYLDHGVCDRHWNQLTAEDAAPEALRMVLGIEATAPTAMEAVMSETTKSKKTKAAKTPKPKKERAPKEDLVVFAFRLTEAERKKIHATAGSAKASRFIRSVSAAFANEDESAFKAVIKEAREARA